MSILPNCFQIPNSYIDDLMAYLTPQEVVVLVYATRHILGWQNKITERIACISVSQFTKGNTKFGACGLGGNAVMAALRSLHEYGILVKYGEPDVKGQTYYLQEDNNLFNWKALTERRDAAKRAAAKRTSKARQALCPTNGERIVRQMGSVLSDKRIKSQLKPTSNGALIKDDGVIPLPPVKGINKAPAYPMDVIPLAMEFELLFGRAPTKAEKALWIKALREMVEAGIGVLALRSGYHAMLEQGLTIKSPASIFALADKAQRRRAGQRGQAAGTVYGIDE